MIARDVLEAAMREAIAACDPGPRVRDALDHDPLADDGRRRVGLAIGKAALAMARGAGPVSHGLAVTSADDERPLPDGWARMVSSHPEPDERSVAAGEAVIDLVASAAAGDLVIALISGGASALVERPLDGISLARFRDDIRAVMASGAAIADINAARIARSAIKGGKLAELCEAPILTLAVSDVAGDDIAVIGSGPTIAPGRPGDRARVVVAQEQFVASFYAALAARGVSGYTRPSSLRWASPQSHDRPWTGGVAELAAKLVTRRRMPAFAWGEPSVRIPDDHGEGGRAQQLALELAKLLRGSGRSAFAVGSDGVDGPAPDGRPAPAGAYVDGATWDQIQLMGLDPARALARCDAGTVLHAVGALVITGPTGINHGDIVVVG